MRKTTFYCDRCKAEVSNAWDLRTITINSRIDSFIGVYFENEGNKSNSIDVCKDCAGKVIEFLKKGD